MLGINNEEIIIRLTISALLGSVIGFERERLSWAAGLRTHMLVCVGATLVMIVSAFGFADTESDPKVILDPSRVAAQVVSGIGFLGAGTILLRKEAIRGLTTAASLWAVAGIGLAVGGGMYIPASYATFLILVILAGLKPIEKRMWVKQQASLITIVFDKSEAPLASTENWLKEMPAKPKEVVFSAQPDQHSYEVRLLMGSLSKPEIIVLTEKLRALPGLKTINVSKL